MSYFSYIRSNNKLNDRFTAEDKRVLIEGDRMTWGVKPDNTKLTFDVIDEKKYDCDFNYELYINEFTSFPDHQELLTERFIDQMLELINSFNTKGNKLIIETIWEGGSTGQPYSKYKQVVNHTLINRTMIRAFFEVEDFDYRSIEVTY